MRYGEAIPSVHLVIRVSGTRKWEERNTGRRMEELDVIRESLYRDCIDREALMSAAVPTWQLMMPMRVQMGRAMILHREMLSHPGAEMTTDAMEDRFRGAFHVYEMLPPLVNAGLAVPVGPGRYRAIPDPSHRQGGSC